MQTPKRAASLLCASTPCRQTALSDDGSGKIVFAIVISLLQWQRKLPSSTSPTRISYEKWIQSTNLLVHVTFSTTSKIYHNRDRARLGQTRLTNHTVFFFKPAFDGLDKENQARISKPNALGKVFRWNFRESHLMPGRCPPNLCIPSLPRCAGRRASR